MLMQTSRHCFHLILHSAHLLEEQLRQRLAPLGVQPRQARILNVLDRLWHASQVELATRFDVSPASMSTMTARLTKAGWVTRETDQTELRCNVLSLTQDGRAILSAIHDAWDDVDQAIDEAIGPDNAKKLCKLTFELRNALGGRAPGAPRQWTSVRS